MLYVAEFAFAQESRTMARERGLRPGSIFEVGGSVASWVGVPYHLVPWEKPVRKHFSGGPFSLDCQAPSQGAGVSMAHKAVHGIEVEEVSQITADMLIPPLRWVVRRKGAEEMEDRRAGWLRWRGSLSQ